MVEIGAVFRIKFPHSYLLELDVMVCSFLGLGSKSAQFGLLNLVHNFVFLFTNLS
jgi:hypothetical protein